MVALAGRLWQARTVFRRWWWLLVLAIGPLEFLAHWYFAQRAPGLSEYQALAPRLSALRKSGDVLLVAPAWAAPIARTALGDGWFSERDLGRLDLKRYPRAVVVKSLGQELSEVQSFRVVSSEIFGRFTLEVRENPGFEPLRADLVEGVSPDRLGVTLVLDSGEQLACSWTTQATVEAGGLAGPAAFPRARFQCPGGNERLVGVSILDDQDFRPRRCIWAHPPDNGYLELKFQGVPFGGHVFGAAGLSYLLTRDGAGANIELEVWGEGKLLGRHLERDVLGWQSFAMALPARGEGSTFELSFRVRSENAAGRDFCFQAEIR